jgi:hypothetical protein
MRASASCHLSLLLCIPATNATAWQRDPLVANLFGGRVMRAYPAAHDPKPFVAI